MAGILLAATVALLIGGAGCRRQGHSPDTLPAVMQAGSGHGLSLPRAPGQAAETAPQDPVVFDVSPRMPARTPVLLPAKAKQVYCWFKLPSAAEGNVTGRWSLNGEDLGPVPAPQAVVYSDGYISGQVILRPPARQQQFPAGIYVVELKAAGSPACRASFVMAEDAEKILRAKAPAGGAVMVENMMTAAKVDAQGWPLALADEFRPTDRVWVRFDYANGIPGLALQVQWLYRGVELKQAAVMVPMEDVRGACMAWMQAQEGNLPPGRYQVRVLLAGNAKPLGSAGFVVLEPGRKPKTRPGPPRPQQAVQDAEPGGGPSPAKNEAPATTAGATRN